MDEEQGGARHRILRDRRDRSPRIVARATPRAGHRFRSPEGRGQAGSTACVWVVRATRRPRSSVTSVCTTIWVRPECTGRAVAGPRTTRGARHRAQQVRARLRRRRPRPRRQPEEGADGARGVGQGHQRAAVQQAAGGGVRVGPGQDGDGLVGAGGLQPDPEPGGEGHGRDQVVAHGGEPRGTRALIVHDPRGHRPAYRAAVRVLLVSTTHRGGPHDRHRHPRPALPRRLERDRPRPRAARRSPRRSRPTPATSTRWPTSGATTASTP